MASESERCNPSSISRGQFRVNVKDECLVSNMALYWVSTPLRFVAENELTGKRRQTTFWGPNFALQTDAERGRSSTADPLPRSKNDSVRMAFRKAPSRFPEDSDMSQRSHQ